MKKHEADDPYELVGVRLPSPPGYDGGAEMARCFVEEFAMVGCTFEEIFALFRDPFYAGPHSVYSSKGDTFVRDLIGSVLGKELKSDA